MRILGVSCDYHDAAAALIVDGDVVAAVEQERLSRRKHDAGLPEDAIASCLAIGGVEPDRLDAVVFHEKPFLVLSRVLAARQRRGPSGLSSAAAELPLLLRRNLFVGLRLERALRRLGATAAPEIRFADHHTSHAAAAFYPSPFDEAAVLTIDGVGEWTTASIGHGRGAALEVLTEQRYPHSVGLLYSLVTAWCGFEPNDGEYKVMGLAPYGEPAYLDQLRQFVTVHPDGSISIDQAAVHRWGGRPERNRRLAALFDGPPRAPGTELTDREADLARSVQELVEEVVLRMAVTAQERTGSKHLCLAGGVALNCVANGRLDREGTFDGIWVQPAAGDAGSALGAALWYWHGHRGESRARPVPAAVAPATLGVGEPLVDGMHGALLGPRFDPVAIRSWLTASGIAHRAVTDVAERNALVAEALAAGQVVGCFQGRMEFGPRSLGNRSILADPRSSTAQSDLNLRVKGRESFRPFAPAVLAEEADRWYELDGPSPYMLFTAALRPEHRFADQAPVVGAPWSEGFTAPPCALPACTHVDWSARVQTVHASLNPAFHALLSAFHERTGCPVLVNTSFNVAGEPIVGTPEDAVRTARAAGLDLLVLEDCLLTRDDLVEVAG
ncbi:MAG: hypothetical protein JWM47_1709 [Acidimicrobiales bacterium]|nr:hypothetical protein [Acidimicrobiales bacterium]